MRETQAALNPFPGTMTSPPQKCIIKNKIKNQYINQNLTCQLTGIINNQQDSLIFKTVDLFGTVDTVGRKFDGHFDKMYN